MVVLVTNFSMIDEEETSRNFTSRGGTVEPQSDEHKIQEQRDSSTLMVVYTTIADIPPTPREPAAEIMGTHPDEQKFGEPGDLVKVRDPIDSTQLKVFEAVNRLTICTATRG